MTDGDTPAREPGSPPVLDADAEADRVRRVRRFWAFAQAGGIAFLGVVSLGLLPTILAASFPAAGEKAAVLVWVAAPALPILLLVVAAFRLPR